VFLEMGLSKSTIAKRLGRHRSTIYNEINRNAEREGYFPVVAHNKTLARKRKKRPCKILGDPALYHYILRYLKEGWAPEQIAGRMKMEGKKYYACHETIYRYIYLKSNKELYQYLPYKKPKRRRHFARKHHCRYGDRRLITERPEDAETRNHYGHWEGDTIVFHGSRKKSVTTLVERKSRFVYLVKNSTKTSFNVMAGITDKFIGQHDKVCKTITFDQGSEFADNISVEAKIPCEIYYCEAHSPWQKGSNENMNGRLRRYLPRDTIIDHITQQHLDLLAKKMNNVPRKCLGFKKPNELMVQYRRNLRRIWS